MLLFNKKKLDPIVRLKLKEKTDKILPVIIMLKEPLSKKLRNSIIKNGGKLKYEFNYINAAAAWLTLESIDKLSELPEVISISYDRKANLSMDKTSICVGAGFNSPYNLTGRHVVTAVIDSGVYPHGDLLAGNRAILHFKDFINQQTETYDDNGHGTFICGVIAGSGNLSKGKYKGIAPLSRIIMLKAFNSVGEGAFSDILAAIGWVVENRESYNIKILCLPFGADAIVPCSMDPLCKACNAAWDLGIMVVAASGNKGPEQGTITTPGIDPSIITVGCCQCSDTSIRNWKIPEFSGRGSRKDKETKPDFIAPGCSVTSLSSDKSYMPVKGTKTYPPSLISPYCTMTGSSVSAAVAAGCIALYLEKTPDISGKDLKGVLKLCCQTINEVRNAQGSGVLNIGKALS